MTDFLIYTYMKYIKTFLEKQGNYSDALSNPKRWNNSGTIGTSGNTKEKPELKGEIVDEEDEDDDIVIPLNVEITGHIGTPVKNTRVGTISKEPSIRI